MPDKTFAKAVFVKSAADPKGLLFDRPSILFLGRSNVGKSTLINLLTRNKTLMKASKTPGRTKMINYALIDELFYLCDAPGYGFATYERDYFGPLMNAFLEENPSLSKVYLLIDSRRRLLPADQQFLDFLSSKEIPFAIVFTKTDKLGKSERYHLEEIKKKLDANILECSVTDRGSQEKIRSDILASVRMKIAELRRK